MDANRIGGLLLAMADEPDAERRRALAQQGIALLNPGELFPQDLVLHHDSVAFTDDVRHVPWLVRIVWPGHQYGSVEHNAADAVFVRACVNNCGEPLIEFWDRRWNHDPEFKAQFVGRYFASVLKAHVGALRLDSEPDWKLSDRSMALVREHLLERLL
jgi:hypothetical protein